MSAVIRVDSLNKTFARKQALFNLKLEIQAGEMVALIGASGSGKSTLLRHVAGLARCDRDNGGSIDVLGRRLQASERRSAPPARRHRLHLPAVQPGQPPQRAGQRPARLPRSHAALARFAGLFSAEQKRQALEALARVGLADFAGQRASTLSGGQQQRVAIARALTQKAEVILADEPIASLDPESARKVMDILADINRHDGKTVVVTLHQVDYALRYCPRAVALKGGRILFDGSSEHLSEGFLNELYGAEGDTPLLFSDRARRGAESQPELTLARA